LKLHQMSLSVKRCSQPDCVVDVAMSVPAHVSDHPCQ
jgi:hypothetical protein